MSALETVRRVLENPKLLRGKVRQTCRDLNVRLADRPNRGVRIMEEDWDNLYILDGCRYDAFRELAPSEGKLSKKISRGSMSWEFMQENFAGERFHDTVYVTANPYAARLEDDVFHDTIDLLDEWDPERQTVPPDAVAEALLDANERYPSKRLLGHFMQPHHPFLGETGRKLEHSGFRTDHEDEHGDPSVWAVLRYGYRGYDDVSEAAVWEAYLENLEIVLEHVEPLVEEISGKSVITSDHGNLIGERLSPIPIREYGHPEGVRAPELIEVPWFEIDSDVRKTIRAEEPREREDADQSTVDDRLKALGYR